MTTFKKGDRVKIKGTGLTGTVCDLYLSNKLADVIPEIEGTDGALLVNWPVTLLELAEPHSWPPQVGDIWVTADETEFYVMSHGLRSWARPFRAEEGLSYAVNEAKEMERFMALEPVLVRRRGVN